jgi:hypothetical protein
MLPHSRNDDVEERLGYPTIIYTPGFARSAAGWLDEATVRRMENQLAGDPHSGIVIPRANGARKMRLALPGRGKSGSARVIYVYAEVKGRVYCLLAYRKNTQEDLTPEQSRALAAVIEALKGEP